MAALNRAVHEATTMLTKHQDGLSAALRQHSEVLEKLETAERKVAKAKEDVVASELALRESREAADSKHRALGVRANAKRLAATAEMPPELQAIIADAQAMLAQRGDSKEQDVMKTRVAENWRL